MSDLTDNDSGNQKTELARLLTENNFAGLFNSAEPDLGLELSTGFFYTPGLLNSLDDLIQWLDDEKAKNHILAKREGLNTLADWLIDRNGHIVHKDKRFFKIVGMKVVSSCREVDSWSQPILSNMGSGLTGLLMKQDKGITYFLMQAKADVGNRSIVQLGPTVQFNPGNYIDNNSLLKPFLFDEFLNPGGFIKISESMQAEEGGRFYRESNMHRILMLPSGTELNIPVSYRWFSCNQIRFFLHMGDFVNSCARSILSCLI